MFKIPKLPLTKLHFSYLEVGEFTDSSLECTVKLRRRQPHRRLPNNDPFPNQWTVLLVCGSGLRLVVGILTLHS